MAKSITSFNANDEVAQILQEVPKGKVTEFVNKAILNYRKPEVKQVAKLQNVRVKP